MSKKNSPYSAALTGCGFMFFEFMRMLPVFLEADSLKECVKTEADENTHLLVNSASARKRFLLEFSKRFQSVERSFWINLLQWPEPAQRIGVLYSILRTYRLLFDFHHNVVIRHWNSANPIVTSSDLGLELSEIAANDSFVNSWSDGTRKHCISHYLTMLRQSGLMKGNSNELTAVQLTPEFYQYYILAHEEWFLSACLLYPFQIKALKQELA